MSESNNYHQDIIDEDLYEEIDDEELLEILKEERRKAYEKEAEDRKAIQQRPFPRWIFWAIAAIMLVNVIAIIPQTYSIPAIEFLKTSAQLSTDPLIDEYQQSVVVVRTEDGKGTGFSIASDGIIITNHHVIEDSNQVTISFPEHGYYVGEVIESYPDVDLAIISVDGSNLPFLELAEQTVFEQNEKIRFIGNPLSFSGIANEGNVIGYTKLNSWEKAVIMLEAPVYRGNSGSPVINRNSEVIGVVFATMNHDQHGRVGLAVPIDYYYEKIHE